MFNQVKEAGRQRRLNTQRDTDIEGYFQILWEFRKVYSNSQAGDVE